MSRLSLRNFLNAAYAILIGEAQRLGMDILSAREAVDNWISMPGAKPMSEGPTEADNTRALAELAELTRGLNV